MEAVSQRVKNIVGEQVLSEIGTLLQKIHEKATTPLVRAVPQQLAEALAVPVNEVGATTTLLLLQFRPGDMIPPHVEKYRERIVCLEGEYEDGEGRVHRVGEIEEVLPGQRHQIVAKANTTLFMQWIPALELNDIAKLRL